VVAVTAVERKPVSAAAQHAGRRIAEHRRALGLTQQELAEAAGLARTSVANVEGGRQEIPLAVAVAMAAKLGTTVGELLGEEQHTPLPGTSISLGWQVACDKCGPVTFALDHDEARDFRTSHLRRVHLERP
jgi:putative transcriptional regulator